MHNIQNIATRKFAQGNPIKNVIDQPNFMNSFKIVSKMCI